MQTCTAFRWFFSVHHPLHKKAVFHIISGFILLTACSTSPDPDDPLHDFSGKTMGTTYSVRYSGDSVALLQVGIDSLLRRVNESLSTYISSSRISVLNQSQNGSPIDAHLRVNFLKSLEINEQSGGAFDPSVGPLTEVWGFGYSQKTELPDSSTVDSIRAFVGLKNFQLLGDSLIKLHPKARLDMSAIAKGYGVDQVATYLLSRQIQNFIVEIGGEVRAHGRKSKAKSWMVGIEKPQSGAGRIVQRALPISNRSMATSGNYRNFKEIGGRKIVHTLSPQTGYPIENDLLSATVLAEDCMTADAWATAFMVMGFERARQKCGELKGIDVVFIYSDSNNEIHEYSSPGMGSDNQ